MSDSSARILQSLERVSELLEDPSAPVYENLFARYPEFKGLFRFEPNGELARQNMFQVTVVALMEHLDGRHSAVTMVNSERTNHAHIGVDNASFDRYYEVVLDTFHEILGDEWTAETEAAWNEAIQSLIGATHEWNSPDAPQPAAH